MARTIAIIQQQMIAKWQSEPVLAAANSPSQVSIWKLLLFIPAVGIGLFEQLLDIYKTQIEVFASTIAPGTPSWYQNQVNLFQYDAVNPQIVQLVDFVPTYAVVNPALRIISRCSVKTNSNKVVNIKVATAEPPTTLSGSQVSALEAHLTEIGFAGTETSVINLASDKLICQAVVYYNGQYASTIQADVIAAMDLYLKNIPFSSNDPASGKVKVSALSDSVQSVAGVTDFVFQNVSARLNTSAIINGSPLVVGGATINRVYETGAGYIVQETTAGFTFADLLTFIVAN